jgi:hypothetical protein
VLVLSVVTVLGVWRRSEGVWMFFHRMGGCDCLIWSEVVWTGQKQAHGVSWGLELVTWCGVRLRWQTEVAGRRCM